ncbi:unnamed protein product [Vitrella brassicaformis CCMP3155]|uniref:Uncharacterized protein n=1 Tax=Vitrella brassicaformis (strain CCMP3155) TaxID=1169540 RepID=A0A0G4FB71_VITBC|nr:unnamed protein product [Vitrella brassicaformis CCMP3155]|mmetsp:Transcript_36838/g.92370  ORF Transcript_36838/g.92370 Transcript_36838/m.92370 type:complete len:267 (-) Transcript_36838:20-820(-)|eukprot:CEM10188.1 unnamed protein product [Vitrella brassicaformis CCMP3155]
MTPQVGLVHVYTAAQSLGVYLERHAPKGAKIWVVGGASHYKDTTDSCFIQIKKTVKPELYSTWEIRTNLPDEDFYRFASCAQKNEDKVFVALCSDTPNDKLKEDPVTHESGYSDWSYHLLSRITQLMLNKATLVNACIDPLASDQPHGDVIMHVPSCGAFEHFFKFATFPFGKIVNTGKGGGLPIILEEAHKKLKLQPAAKSLKLGKDNLAMVGDVPATDMQAAEDYGIRSIFVLSGATTLEQAAKWKVRPTCYLDDVGKIGGVAE